MCEYCRKNRLGINTSPSFWTGRSWQPWVSEWVWEVSLPVVLGARAVQCKTRARGAVGRCAQKHKTRVFTQAFDCCCFFPPFFFQSKETKKTPHNTYGSTHNRLGFINLLSSGGGSSRGAAARASKFHPPIWTMQQMGRYTLTVKRMRPPCSLHKAARDWQPDSERRVGPFRHCSP